MIKTDKGQNSQLEAFLLLLQHTCLCELLSGGVGVVVKVGMEGMRKGEEVHSFT